jgi:threonine aldolase
MVFFTLDHPARVVEALPAKLLERGIKINGVSAGELRFVTSNDVTREDLAVVADCLEALLKEG